MEQMLTCGWGWKQGGPFTWCAAYCWWGKGVRKAFTFHDEVLDKMDFCHINRLYNTSKFVMDTWGCVLMEIGHGTRDICDWVWVVQREVAEHIVAALDASGGGMDQLCRLLLAADSYQVLLLRNHCLAGLAQAFQSLHSHTPREQATFQAFVEAVAPKASGATVAA